MKCEFVNRKSRDGMGSSGTKAIIFAEEVNHSSQMHQI